LLFALDPNSAVNAWVEHFSPSAHLPVLVLIWSHTPPGTADSNSGFCSRVCKVSKLGAWLLGASCWQLQKLAVLTGRATSSW